MIVGMKGNLLFARQRRVLYRTSTALVIAMMGVLATIGVSIATSAPAAAVSISAIISNVPGGVGAVTTDSSGDIFVGGGDGNVYAWSSSGTTLFGTTVPADTLTALTSSGLGQIFSLTFEVDNVGNGDLWVSDSTYGLQVIDPVTTTLYGVAVTADTPSTVEASTSSTQPMQATFDSDNDLIFAVSATTSGAGSVDMDPLTSGTYYGQPLAADDITPLVTNLDQPNGVAVDGSGDLFYSDQSADTVGVETYTNATIFGVLVTADTPTTLFTDVSGVDRGNGFVPGSMQVDASGNLYFVNESTSVSIVTNSNGTYIGTPVSAFTPTNLNLEMDADGIAFNSSGQLLIADTEDDSIDLASAPTATITGVAITGSLDNPTMTITGAGFGSEPTSVAPGCSASGSVFNYSVLVISDDQQQWQAGIPGDCIGFNIVSWTATQVVATFGNWYTDQLFASGNQIHSGDTLAIGVAGAYVNGGLPTVTQVAPDFGPASGGTTVTITGSGFTGATSVDFGPGAPAAGFTVDSDSQITATAPAESVGTVDVTVTTPISTSSTSSADQYTFDPDVSSDYSCSVPGVGSTSFPVDVTESPQPPAAEDAGASFEEALALQVTVPTAVVNHYDQQGASSFTLETQSAAEDALSSPDGAASGAVETPTETASATNVPQVFVLTFNQSITYQTAYDPVTWTTGPGTGDVYLTPGDINIVLAYQADAGPQTITIGCTPPSNEGSLGEVTVDPAASSPTFQVPTSTPAIQNGVTSPNDDGWTFTVANTSSATVTGVQTQVTVTDSGSPPTFDTAAITASGTKGCTVTSPGVLTCNENSLAAGASDTVNVLVETNGLAAGVAVTGSASVTSTNAGSGADNLGQFSVVVVTNGTEASAVPGITLSSTTESLSDAGATVKLTLPKNKIPANGALAYGSDKVHPPVVGLTLVPVPQSEEPSLCPSESCTAADAIEASGNFAAFVNPADPIIAALQFYFGSATPSGSVYMLESSGTVLELPACKQSKTTGDWNTPCVKGKVKTKGSGSNLSAKVTVYFTGNDPGFSLR
ncbi:MAG: IPT/TIG domain-containing protein [Acidimicrobiales bacterium]